MKRWLRRLLMARSGQPAPAPDPAARLEAARQRLKKTIEPVQREGPPEE